MKVYGSLNNRFEENKMFCNEIEVGTPVTKYSYSDRDAYEVIFVKDQKHVTIRRFDHKAKEGSAPMSNEWVLISNESNPGINIVKRGNYWYVVKEVSKNEYENRKDDDEFRFWCAMNGFDVNKIMEKGIQRIYDRINISFGVADYYYDYEF